MFKYANLSTFNLKFFNIFHKKLLFSTQPPQRRVLQGYILKVLPVREEDCVVFVLTATGLFKTYRFYAARHSVVMTGFKIDFELEESPVFLPRLRRVMQYGFSWLAERERFGVWQNFCRLCCEHLSQVENLEPFYFELFENAARKMSRQNPYRVVVEAFLELLFYEGRLAANAWCEVCEKPLQGEVALGRAFVPTHAFCSGRRAFGGVGELFASRKTTHLEDDVVKALYEIVCEGF